MVSLPIKWAKRNKISKGDTVNVLEEYNSLILTKGILKEEIRKVEIEIKEEYKNTLVRAIISNLYRSLYTKALKRTSLKKAKSFFQRMLHRVSVEVRPSSLYGPLPTQ